MKSDLDDAIEKGVNTKLMNERSKVEKKLREQIADEKSGELKSLQEQLELKIKDTKELNKVKAEFARLQREKDEMKEKIEAEAEEKITEKVTTEKMKIRKEFEEKNEFKNC